MPKELKIEPYCQNCPRFEPVLGFSDSNYIYQTVVCSDREGCDVIFQYLKRNFKMEDADE